MTQINKCRIRTTGQILSFFVIALGVGVLLGWQIDNQILKSGFVGSSTMKPSLAISFILLSISSLLFQYSKNFKIYVGIVTISMFVFMLMFMLLIQAIAQEDWGVGNMFFFEESNTFMSVGNGIPSLGSIIVFAMASFFTLYELHTNGSGMTLTLGGIILTAVGLSACIGYACNVPQMYFYVVGKSTAMAINTALGLITLGLSFIFYKLSYK